MDSRIRTRIEKALSKPIKVKVKVIRKPQRKELDPARLMTPALRKQAHMEARQWGEIRGEYLWQKKG